MIGVKRKDDTPVCPHLKDFEVPLTDVIHYFHSAAVFVQCQDFVPITFFFVYFCLESLGNKQTEG